MFGHAPHDRASVAPSRRRAGVTVTALTLAITLLIPGVAVAHQRYTVRAGDTLAKIAAAQDVDGGWRALYRDNQQLNDPDVIFAGQRLLIPGPGPYSPVSSAPSSTESSTETSAPRTSSAASRSSSSSSSSSTSSSAPSSGVWYQLAECESGGDWSINTGNGFSGGLQFHPDTWVNHGGTAYASAAYLASPAQQIAVAEKVLDSQGWGAWPACSDALGLR